MPGRFAYRVNQSSYFLEGSSYGKWQVIEDFEGVATGSDPPGWFSTVASDWGVRTTAPVYQGEKTLRFTGDGVNSNSTMYLDDPNAPLLPGRGDTLGGHVHLGVRQNRGGIMYGVEMGRGQAYPEHYAVIIRGEESDILFTYDNLAQSAQTIASRSIDTTGIASAHIRIRVHYGDPTHTIRATLLGDNPRVLAEFSADHGSGQMLKNDNGIGARGTRRVQSTVSGASHSFDQFFMY